MKKTTIRIKKGGVFLVDKKGKDHLFIGMDGQLNSKSAKLLRRSKEKKESKTKDKGDEHFIGNYGSFMTNFYDYMLLQELTHAPYGYKYVNLPIYKYHRKIKTKESCFCSDCGNKHYQIIEKEIGCKKIREKRTRVPKTFDDIIMRLTRNNKKPKFIKFKEFAIKK